MNVLIACEESQRVCTAFRERGHNAFSCDIQNPSGGYPEWHILGDVTRVLNPISGSIDFDTMDGVHHTIGGEWDLIIAHPPCIYLTHAATRMHSVEHTPVEKINERTLYRIHAMQFFMQFVFAECKRIAIENPVGIMNTAYRKPDQIISPWMFCESENDSEYVTKRTCLWLKNLPELVVNDIQAPDNAEKFGRKPSGKVLNWCETIKNNRSVERSKTFYCIARAMVEQWG